MLNPGLENKVVLVTGGNHGIGSAIAEAFASQGAKVFITYFRIKPESEISPEDAKKPGMAMYALGRSQDADTVLKTIRDSGGIAEAWEADLSNPDVIPQLFDKVEATLGAVDIVVNNAAHWEPSTFIPQTETLANQFSVQWMDNKVPTFNAGIHDRAFAVNARGTALMMTEFAKRNIQRGAKWGRIINISTDGAYCFPSEATYGASKHALESYSRTAATELGQFGITVNIVSPGPIQTGYITEPMQEAIGNHIPLRRVGYPDDIADVVLFLASEQARWLTGQLLHVGGGHKM